MTNKVLILAVFLTVLFGCSFQKNLSIYDCGEYEAIVPKNELEKITNWWLKNIYHSQPEEACYMGGRKYLLSAKKHVALYDGLYLLDLSKPLPVERTSAQSLTKVRGGILWNIISDKSSEKWAVIHHPNYRSIDNVALDSYEIVSLKSIASGKPNFRLLYEANYATGGGSERCMRGLENLRYGAYINAAVYDYDNDGYQDVVFDLDAENCETGQRLPYRVVYLAVKQGFEKQPVILLHDKYFDE